MVLTTLRDLFGFIQLKAVVVEESSPTDDATASVCCCESLVGLALAWITTSEKVGKVLTGSRYRDVLVLQLVLAPVPCRRHQCR